MNLYTKESGTGQPMVLLHGNGEDSSYFVNQMSFFESKYHVIAVDTRGHGRSPRGQGAFTLERFAEDLKEFLDRRGLRRIILLGFSDGGNTKKRMDRKDGINNREEAVRKKKFMEKGKTIGMPIYTKKSFYL